MSSTLEQEAAEDEKNHGTVCSFFANDIVNDIRLLLSEVSFEEEIMPETLIHFVPMTINIL